MNGTGTRLKLSSGGKRGFNVLFKCEICGSLIKKNMKQKDHVCKKSDKQLLLEKWRKLKP